MPRPSAIAGLTAHAILLVASTTRLAYGRPGGGGSFHSGGGGGGFHSGGGGGGFQSGGGGFHSGGGIGTIGGASSGGIFPILLLAFIILVVVVGMTIAKRQRQGVFAPTDGDDPGPDDLVAERRGGDPLAALRARDPALTDASIVEHVRQMADKLREAWCAGDMGPARAFVSDGVFSRFQVQLGLMAGENRRNVMGDARVLDVVIDGAEDADPLDVVHVRVDAEARDTEVPWNATAEEIAHALKHAPVEPYSEIWSISRCAGAQSKPAGYEVGRACPRCGAPLAPGETMKCRYCGAVICSGEHDWVLAEITQVSEWGGGGRPPSGLADLRAHDPGVAREALEDRASYVFWKWVQAARSGSWASLRKCATPALLGAGAHVEWVQGATDVAVGSADLVGCEVNPGGRGFDCAHVQVAWSARPAGSREHTSSQIVVRLVRRTGVTSKPSLTALTCPQCGAPLAETESSRCDHCGAELADGGATWVLDDLTLA